MVPESYANFSHIKVVSYPTPRVEGNVNVCFDCNAFPYSVPFSFFPGHSIV